MEHLSYQEVDKYPTPFFLFDEVHLLNQVEIIKKAFEKYWTNGLIAYSVKTNSLPYLAKVLNKAQVAAEVVSEDEFDFINKVADWNGSIVCNGPIKGEGWIKKIFSQGCYLNIDSKNELEIVEQLACEYPHKQFNVGIRINNNIEDVFPNVSTAGINGSRFGFSDETGELCSAINKLQKHNNIHIIGLHLHTSTNLRSLDIYRYIAKRFDEIVKKYELSDIEFLDAGGGFYGEVPNKPQWADYLSAIAEELKKRGYSPEKLKIIIEPGVSLLSGCFSYYTRVVDIKDTTRSHFVVFDGSRIHVDPLMHKTKDRYFTSILKNQKTSLSSTSQVLVGFTCLEYDTFFSLENEESLVAGDLLRFDKVGAYTLTFSPLFISWFPAVYAINKGKIKLVRNKWTSDEFLQKSIL